MIKRIFGIGIASLWALAGLLPFTQMPALVMSYDLSCEPGPVYPCVEDFGDHFWVDSQYLFWKIKNCPEHTPFVYKGPSGGKTPPVLGDKGTSVVLGGKDIDTHWRSGGKFTFGYWFDDRLTFGGEINYFFVPNTWHSQSVSSDGSRDSTLLRIPYFDVRTSQESSAALATPRVFSGKASLKLVNRMQGTELNLLQKFPSFAGVSITGLGGFRYWCFKEHLSFVTSSPFVDLPLDIYKSKEHFNTENDFVGGQFGLLLTYNWKRFFVTAKTKLALGGMYGTVDIKGELATNEFTDLVKVQHFPGGYFALPTNIGKHRRTKFAVLPEVNLTVGCELFDCGRIELGYTFLYANKVLRAGKQVNPNINPTQSTIYTNTPKPKLKGKRSPQAEVKTEGLWAQGLNVGIVFQF